MCNYWNECAAQLIRKFLFRRGTSLNHVAKILCRTYHSQVHIIFRDLPLDLLPRNTWAQCSERAQAVDIRQCMWSPRTTLVPVIKYCTNLKSLSIRGLCNVPKNLCPSRLLYKVQNDEEDGIQLEKLAIHNFRSEDNIVRRLFGIYPNLKHWAFSCGRESRDNFFLCPNLLFGAFNQDTDLYRDCYNKLESFSRNASAGNIYFRTLMRCITQNCEHIKFVNLLRFIFMLNLSLHFYCLYPSCIQY